MNPLALQANVAKGEPYGSNVTDVLEQLRKYSGVTRLAQRAAPLLIQNGWNDDLFEPLQGIRTYNMLRAREQERERLPSVRRRRPPARVEQEQHRLLLQQRRARASSPTGYSGRGEAEAGRGHRLHHHLPADAPGAGPYSASSLDRLAERVLPLRREGTQTVSSGGGSPFVSLAFTPIIGTLNACKTAPLVVQPGSAAYRRIVRKRFTLLGLPTVSANIRTNGPYGQLDALLWDVSPSGRQRLVSREAYRLRPNQTGPGSSSSAATATASPRATSCGWRSARRTRSCGARATGSSRSRCRTCVALPTLERRPNQP